MSKQAIIWGFNPNPNYGLTQPIRLAKYESKKQHDNWKKYGWMTAVYPIEAEPSGFFDKIAKMRKELQLAEASR
ncbi:MAG: hypothetical protein EBR82_39400 [Caulobacteraceae bacterium]|nr:hypothetical protein [Caulobacteraceae bacterium]